MIGMIKGFLGGIWGYVAVALGAVAGVASLYLTGRKAGKTEASVDALKKGADDVQKANEVDRQVAVAKPDAVATELRNDWTRD